MTDAGRGRADGSRMSHAEAERLISARLDAPLDLNQNRVLLAHLATCDSCRAFAANMESMSTEFRALPVLPASPVVSRQVRARIAQQPSPWSWLSGALFNGRWGPIPAAAAGVALVAVIAVALILRGSDPNNGSSPLAAPTTNLAMASATGDASRTPNNGNPNLSLAASQTPKFINVQVTPTFVPTETATPQPTETAPPTDTATTAPTETATAQPTETPTTRPTGTATVSPADTATAKPVATATLRPVIVPTKTATEAPTQPPAATATDTPKTTATARPTRTPADTATAEPTQTPSDTATATVEPTVAPADTATAAPTGTRPSTLPDVQEPATPVAQPTAKPTRTATKKPAKTPTPTETPTSEPPPTIAPANGGQTSQVIDTPTSDQSIASTASGASPSDVQTPTELSADSQIIPIGTQSVSATDTPKSAPTDAAVVGDAKPTKTPKPDRKPAETTVSGSDSSAIGQAQQLAQMPAAIEAGAVVRANPNGALFVVADRSGCTIYDFSGNVVGSIPGAQRPFWSVFGTAMLISAPSDGGMKASIWSISSQSVFPVNAPSDRAYVDFPAGADSDAFYFVRSFSDGIEVHRTLLDGNSNPDSAIWKSKDQLSGEPVVTAAGVVFAAGGSFWTVTPDGNGTKVSDDPFGDVRAPLQSPGGANFAFIAGDQIIAATSSSPGSGAAIPYSASSGGGFAFSPSGDQIAVADGDTLSIYANDGHAAGHIASSNGAALTVVAWTNDGIVVVENGDQPILRLVPPDSVTAGGN